ncbi:hypothetical protein [Hydrogenophaga sp. BPS33]|uniref:hypothetical protein n=1 Tax=Hydrogenophaga sp. BPS33 TaxID=2651974 RepID=UPI0013201634|nr:hypothetical protein [Hydrogenophaga sp. BPS33]QHE88470.1 hypothetical protein F9K07_28105 [Hydrogenophaga sp. BPS33]
MKRFFAFSAVWLSVVLTGCATGPKTLAPDVASGIQRLAVVSATGGEFIRKYVGVTVFGNELDKKNITDWQLDKAYEEQMAAAARQVFNATVVQVDYPVADFARVNDLKTGWDVPANWGPHWDSIEAPVQQLCASHKLDAVLVAARQKSADPFSQTNQFVYGAGVYTARRAPAMLHLLTSVSLMDCKTGKTLAFQWLHESTTGRWNRPVATPLPEELARTPIAQWTPEMEARLREDLLALPKDAWLLTLRSMVSVK